MSIPLDIENEWKSSRAEALAGSGFRYQDTATLLALIRCWRGEIHANISTPESNG
jgi:hypothetical protein